MTYSPPGGGIMVERVDTRGNRVMASEDEERKAGYRAQVWGSKEGRGVMMTMTGTLQLRTHPSTSCVSKVTRLKKEMEDLRTELAVEKQK